MSDTEVEVKDDSFVQKIREKLEDEFENNDDKYCSYFFKLALENDIHIERFAIYHNYDENATFEAMKNAMSWWRTTKLADIKDQDFPREFYDIGGFFIYEPDKDGKPLLYIRTKFNRKEPLMDDVIKKFVAYKIKQIDEIVINQGRLQSWGIIFDLSDSSITNMDLTFLIYLVDLLKNYFPKGVAYCVSYRLPWLLQWVQKVAFTLLPSDASNYSVNHDETTISELVPLENLPDFMGGYCQRSYIDVPDGCPDLKSFCEDLKIPEQDINRFINFHDECLLEDCDDCEEAC